MIVTPTAHGGPPKPFYMQLYFQVLFGVILGVTLGHFVPEFAVLFKPMGDAFIKIVKMMIVPVVFCTIVIGIATVGGDQSIGKTLLKAMALFYVLTIIALATGLVAVETMKPGVGMHIAASSIDPSEAARYAKNAKPLDFIDVLLHIIPQSFFTPFAEGEVLPVLFISIITGFGLRRAGKAGQPFLGGLEIILDRTFCSVRFPDEARTIRCFRCNRLHHCQERYQIGWQSRTSDSDVLRRQHLLCVRRPGTAVAISRVQSVEAASLYQGGIAGCSRHVVYGTGPASDALQAGETRLQQGCRWSYMPLGYSFNLDGTAIYLTLASVFLAQAMDIQLTQWQILSMIFVMLLTSKGAAGVTGSGFAALVATLAAMPDTVPVAGVVIIAGIDRFMSEARALTSLCSNAVACVVVAIWEGACDKDVLKRELDGGYVTFPEPIPEGVQAV